MQVQQTDTTSRSFLRPRTNTATHLYRYLMVTTGQFFRITLISIIWTRWFLRTACPAVFIPSPSCHLLPGLCFSVGPWTLLQSSVIWQWGMRLKDNLYCFEYYALDILSWHRLWHSVAPMKSYADTNKLYYMLHYVIPVYNLEFPMRSTIWSVTNCTCSAICSQKFGNIPSFIKPRSANKVYIKVQFLIPPTCFGGHLPPSKSIQHQYV